MCVGGLLHAAECVCVYVCVCQGGSVLLMRQDGRVELPYQPGSSKKNAGRQAAGAQAGQKLGQAQALAAWVTRAVPASFRKVVGGSGGEEGGRGGQCG